MSVNHRECIYRIFSSLSDSSKADILVIFQSSKKTKAKDFNKQLRVFISNLFSKAKIDKNNVYGALLNYGRKPNLIFDFKTHKSRKSLRTAIRKIRANLRDGKADLLAAMKAARNDIFSAKGGTRSRQDAAAAVILITDTKASSSQPAILSEVDAMKRSGISFFTLGIGKADASQLQAIASQPTSDYYQMVSNYKALTTKPEVFDHIIRGIYSRKFSNIP